MVKDDFVFKLGQTKPGEWHLWEVSIRTGAGAPILAIPAFLNEAIAKMSDYDRKDYAQFLVQVIEGAFEKGKMSGRLQVKRELRDLILSGD